MYNLLLTDMWRAAPKFCQIDHVAELGLVCLSQDKSARVIHGA